MCTQGERTLLPLMVRGYAQIAARAYAHPATKMVAVQGITASEIAGDSECHNLEFTSDSEPHNLMDCGYLVFKLSALTISRLGEVFANPTICAYPRTMRSGRKHLAKPAQK